MATNPINSYISGVNIPTRPQGASPADNHPEKDLQDSVQMTSQAQPSPQSDGDDTSVITMRVKVKNSLLQPDEQGKSKLDDLEPDFVPKGTASDNAPTFITALADPGQVPEGYTPVSTVALVPDDQAKDLDALNRDYFAAFVPQGGYAVSQQEIDEFGKQHEDAGYQKGLSEGLDKGAKNAVPPGYQAKLMDSQAGLKIEGKRDQFANILAMVGSTSGALGIAHNIGIPAQYAAPLALATAPLQIFGPTGTLSNMAKLENQKAALLESVKAENPDKDPLQVTVDMNPQTQTAITTEEAIRNIDLLKKTQKLKTLGSALLIGAGVAAIGGWGTAATALAVGSLASPLADALPTFDKMGQVSERKKELKSQLEAKIQDGITAGLSKDEALDKARASTIEVQAPILNEDGQAVSFGPKEVTLGEALDHVSKQQKLLALGAVGAVAQAGSLVAMGLGCPIMMVVGASVALPLLARGALFPSETWQSLKALPGKIWDGIKAIGNAIGRKLGWVKDSPADSTGEAKPMSDAQKTLFKTMADIAAVDPKMAEGLQRTLEALHRPPTNEEEQQAAITAGKEHEAQLALLKAEHPELSQRFEASMKALIEEGAQAAQEAQIDEMHDSVEQVVNAPGTQALLQTPGVQNALKSVKGDQVFAESVVRILAQAEVFGNSEMYEDLLKNEATDPEAARILTVSRAIQAQLDQQQSQPSAA